MKNMDININIVFLNTILFTLMMMFSCDRNSAEPKDCLGIEGGSAIEDECGVCNGNGSSCSDDGGATDGGDDGVVDDCGISGGDQFCSTGESCNNQTFKCTPNDFHYNSSTQQAGYFFLEVTLDGDLISPDDWVGAFNGDVCVGSRNWDTSQCGGGVCEVPVLGQGGESTQGYMESGQIPTFKIFRASDLSYHDAFASENQEWFNNEIHVFDLLSECLEGVPNCSKEDQK
jgi:hypothetical protein